MRNDFLEILIGWPKNFITGTDLKFILNNSYDSCHAIIKRACHQGILLRLRNDVYLIKQALKQDLPNTFELSHLIWGPSYISFESALSNHQWIPERVHVTTSACCKKGKIVTTPIGAFSYESIPLKAFSMGIYNYFKNNTSYIIAHPWKAIGDIIYTRHRSWNNLGEFSEDLRIEPQTFYASDIELLHYLSMRYPSPRTRKILQIFYKELKTS